MLNAASEWLYVDLDVLSEVLSELVALKLSRFLLDNGGVWAERHASSSLDLSHVDVVHVGRVVSLVDDNAIRDALLEAILLVKDSDSVHVAMSDDLFILLEHTIALR